VSMQHLHISQPAQLAFRHSQRHLLTVRDKFWSHEYKANLSSSLWTSPTSQLPWRKKNNPSQNYYNVQMYHSTVLAQTNNGCQCRHTNTQTQYDNYISDDVKFYL